MGFPNRNFRISTHLILVNRSWSPHHLAVHLTHDTFLTLLIAVATIWCYHTPTEFYLVPQQSWILSLPLDFPPYSKALHPLFVRFRSGTTIENSRSSKFGVSQICRLVGFPQSIERFGAYLPFRVTTTAGQGASSKLRIDSTQ